MSIQDERGPQGPAGRPAGRHRAASGSGHRSGPPGPGDTHAQVGFGGRRARGHRRRRSVLPGLLRAGTAAPAAPRPYTVTVKVLGLTAPAGVIGEGTIGTSRWRVVIDRTMGDGCSVGPSVLTCGRAYGAAAGSGPGGVALTSSAASGTQFEVGTVEAACRASRSAWRRDRAEPAAGDCGGSAVGRGRSAGRDDQAGRLLRRAVGVPVRDSVLQRRRRGVCHLAAARPAGPGRRDQAGRRGTLDGIAWRAAVAAGPWGFCASFVNGSSCFATVTPPRFPPACEIVDPLTCGPLSDASGTAGSLLAGVVAVPSDVKDVVLKFDGGGRLRMSAIAIAGTRVLGYAIPDHPAVAQTLEYGVSGQLVHSGPGTGWGCPPGSNVVG